MEEASQKLKRVRERLSLKYRDVEDASGRIANRHLNDEFAISISRLADIENKGTVPTIYRLYALCAVYRLDLLEVLQWFGVNVDELPVDALETGIEKTHKLGFETNGQGSVQFPLAIDPGIDPTRTTFLSRQIQRWGTLPLLLLTALDPKSQLYALIGTVDWFMWPIIPPGSLVVIDESKRKPAEGAWATEFERPIYFVEHRDGYGVAWCSLKDNQLILQPHPASMCHPVVLEYPREADIIGQVSALAMALDPQRTPRARS